MAAVIQMTIGFALETVNKLSYAKRIQIHGSFSKNVKSCGIKTQNKTQTKLNVAIFNKLNQTKLNEI